MSLIELAVLAAFAAFTLTDPTSDALGDGTLVPPTSAVYANSAIFDLHEVSVTPAQRPADADTSATEGGEARSPATTLTVTMGAIEPDAGAAGGFSGAVIDVYFDSAPGGAEVSLVGPGMLLPSGGGWEYAVRISPAGAFGVSYEDQQEVAADGVSGDPVRVIALPPQVALASTDEANLGQADGLPADEPSGQGELSVVPLDLDISGNQLVAELPWTLGEDTVVYAVSGVYDPFSSSGWRALAAVSSPWAFSGGEQAVPVVDVLAADQEAQARALATGVLPRPEVAGDRGLIWLAVMAAGVVLALVGLWFRRQVEPEARTGLPYGLPPEPIETDEPAVTQAEPDDPVVTAEETAVPEVTEEEAVVAEAPEGETAVPAGTEEERVVAEAPEVTEEEVLAEEDHATPVVTTNDAAVEPEVGADEPVEVATSEVEQSEPTPADPEPADAEPDGAKPDNTEPADAEPPDAKPADAEPADSVAADPFDRFGTLDEEDEQEEDEQDNERF